MAFANQLSQRSSSSKFIPFLLDGALGSLLPQESQNHALWSTHTVITQPSFIKQIHKDYINNGANIILTSTYQTSEVGLNKWFPDLKFDDILIESIDIAKEAISETDKVDKVFIAGSVGPYGASLANGAEYTGDYNNISKESLIQYHKRRVELFINDSRIDLLAIETIPNLLEIEALIELLKNESKPFYLSMSVSGTSNKLADGSSLEQIIPLLENIPNLIAVGVNCLSLDDSLKWLKLLKPVGKKLVVYPNSGELWDPVQRVFIGNPNGVITWEEYIKNLKEIGSVLIVGGCCRTTPSSIHEMEVALEKYSSS